MTLTTPHCPAAETLPVDVENKVSGVDGVASVKIELTWEPAWTPQMMSEAARLELNL
jgi:metal-sulfur cluster biosynthetic enzyme